MKEILAKLVESEVLTEDTRKKVTKELTEAIDKIVEEKVETIASVKKAELEKSFKDNFEAERTKLVEAIDAFLDKEMEGALSESIREEYKTKFMDERTDLIEGLSAFLDLELNKINENIGTEDHSSEVAFYESVKSLMLGEQDVPEKAESLITALQESLQQKDLRINDLFKQLVEKQKLDESNQRDKKVEDFIRMLPENKKTIGRRLVEGVSLDDFDARVKEITPELITESNADDKETHNTPKEVIVESHEKPADRFENSRIRQLAGV